MGNLGWKQICGIVGVNLKRGILAAWNCGEYFFWLITYLLILVFAGHLGFRMTIPYYYYQLLSKEHLANRFWESIFHLHAQPPLLNGILGFSLWTERVTGVTPDRLLLWLHVTFGAVIVLCFLRLAKLFLDSRLRRAALLALLVANPSFYYFMHLYSYTLHELLYLALITVSASLFFQRPAVGRWLALCAAVALLIYTRSLFHFVWAITLLVWCLEIAAPRQIANPRLRLQLRICLAAAVVVLLLWPVKNYCLFRIFSYSSWQGVNLARDLPLEQPETYHNMYFLGGTPAGKRAQEEAMLDVPERWKNIPVLAEAVKESDMPNWNHITMLDYSRLMQKRALVVLRKQPGAIFTKASNYYLWYFHRLSARNCWAEWGLPTEQAGIVRWMETYESLTLQPFARDWRKKTLSGFTFVFPLIILLAVLKIWRHRTRKPLQTRTAAVILSAILWVVLMILLVDGREGNRMRFSIEPFVWLLGLWVLPSTRRANATDEKADPHPVKQKP